MENRGGKESLQSSSGLLANAVWKGPVQRIRAQNSNGVLHWYLIGPRVSKLMAKLLLTFALYLQTKHFPYSLQQAGLDHLNLV